MTARLRFRSLIKRQSIEYFTESALAPSRTMDPEPTSLKRTDRTKEPWPHEDVVYGVFRVTRIHVGFRKQNTYYRLK